MTVLDLLHTAISLSKIKVKAQVDKSRFRAYDEKILLANISKICALTGWKPSTNMTSTVEKILDYWRRKVAALYGDSEGDDWWTPHAPNPVVASSGTSPHVVKKEKKRAEKGHAL